jgi:hypothetical protein
MAILDLISQVLYTLLLLINIFSGSTAFGTINGASHYTCFFCSIQQVGYGTVRLLLRKKSTYVTGLSLQKKRQNFGTFQRNSVIKKTKSMRTAGYHVTDQNDVHNQTHSLDN